MTLQEADHFKCEARFLAGLLAADLGFGLAQLGLLILHEDRSIVSLVARLAGHPGMLASAFLVLAVLLLPYLAIQIFSPSPKTRLTVVRLTVHALCAAGVLRIYFAWLSRNLDADTVTGVFLMNGGWCIAMAAVLAYSINNKQKRDAHEA